MRLNGRVLASAETAITEGMQDAVLDFGQEISVEPNQTYYVVLSHPIMTPCTGTMIQVQQAHLISMRMENGRLARTVLHARSNRNIPVRIVCRSLLWAQMHMAFRKSRH